MSAKNPTYREYLYTFSKEIKKELKRIFKGNSKATLKDLKVLLDERMKGNQFVKTRFTKLFLIRNQEFQVVLQLLNTKEGKRKIYKGMELYEEENWMDYFY